jgi:hypothetical protein
MNDNKEILKAIDSFQKENYKFHIETHKKQNDTNGRLLDAEEDIKNLKKVDISIKNQISNLKMPDLTHIITELTKNSTDLKWIKKSHWIVVSASVGTFVTLIVKAYMGL